MELTQLTAISPVDGRYRGKTEHLDHYFSEYALIRYRVKVEIEYFIALCELPLPQLVDIKTADGQTGATLYETLRDIYRNFSVADAQAVKNFEAVTNHDVKAVEYFIKEQFDRLGLERWKEFIHFGLTSQDINNTSVPMSVRDALHELFIPMVEELINALKSRRDEWADIPMLAKTHGQPASPTRLGKEMGVFVYRLEQQLEQMRAVPVSGKFGGATGNFNAHHTAYPNIDWPAFAAGFLSDRLGIERERFTTQISNYDNLAALFDALRRINTIILDLDRDIWMYVSMEYFKQKIKAGEVGSSAMPHKVNPIDFENSEGNIGIANAIYAHLAQKLPVSRLQLTSQIPPCCATWVFPWHLRDRDTVDPQRAWQAASQPPGNRQRPGEDVECGGRGHPDNTAPRGLSSSIRDAQGTDAHECRRNSRKHRRLHRRSRRERRREGGAAPPLAIHIYGILIPGFPAANLTPNHKT